MTLASTAAKNTLEMPTTRSELQPAVDRIVEALVREMPAGLGISIEAKVENAIITRSGDISFSMPIEQNLGIFSTIVSFAHISVSACRFKTSDKTIEWNISMSLNYAHHDGGRNGHNIGTIWLDNNLEYIGHLIPCMKPASGKREGR